MHYALCPTTPKSCYSGARWAIRLVNCPYSAWGRPCNPIPSKKRWEITGDLAHTFSGFSVGSYVNEEEGYIYYQLELGKELADVCEGDTGHPDDTLRGTLRPRWRSGSPWLLDHCDEEAGEEEQSSLTWTSNDVYPYTLKTEMLLWPKVCCFSWMLNTKMLLWVSCLRYTSPLYGALGNTRNIHATKTTNL